MGLTPGRRGVGNRGRGRQEGASSTFSPRKYTRQGTKKAPKPHQQFHWEECFSETSWVPTPHTQPHFSCHHTATRRQTSPLWGDSRAGPGCRASPVLGLGDPSTVVTSHSPVCRGFTDGKPKVKVTESFPLPHVDYLGYPQEARAVLRGNPGSQCQPRCPNQVRAATSTPIPTPPERAPPPATCWD